MQRETISRRIVLLVVVALFGGGVWFDVLANQDEAAALLKVHFLDVGQGDATFIETPDGVHVLIDGGPDASVLRSLASEMSYWDRSIDVLIATHPDSDHIGGLIDVLERYEVAAIIVTENENDTPTAAAFAAAVGREGADIVYARSGASLALGASTTLEILFPDRDPTDFESNMSSIVMQLQYGDIEFMLTGDSPKSIEEYLVLTEGEHLESEVLKVGHHGSRTSTSELFLTEVAPQYAVISAGADNRYGHPHVEVTDALLNYGVEIFSTAEESTITFLSDGWNVWQH